MTSSAPSDLIRLSTTLSALALSVLSAACGGGTGQIDGTITGLTAAGLVLTNGAETLALPANTTRFQFASVLDDGDSYSITVAAQPTGLSCSVAGGSGTFDGSDDANSNATSTDVVVTCVPVFGVSGTVSGLRNSGLELINGGESIAVASGAGTFFFTSRLVSGANYAVTVGRQPNAQTCTVTDGTGTIATASVTKIAVTCI